MNESEITDALATLAPEGDSIERATPAAMAVITSAEVTCQLDAAHRYPRSMTAFAKEALGMATISQEVAASCVYSVPRDGKMIVGASVRLAEICASAYGNLQAGTRVVDEDDKTVTAQGVVWDVQKNVRITVETKRRITTKQGKRYSDDMVITTGNAAASIALRNAIFRVIPRAYIDTIFAQCRRVAVGDARTLVARRDETIALLGKMGVTHERILARLGKKAIGDIGLEELEILIGLGTAIKHQGMGIDEVFPGAEPLPKAPEGKRVKLGRKPAEDPRDPPHEHEPEPDEAGVFPDPPEPGSEG